MRGRGVPQGLKPLLRGCRVAGDELRAYRLRSSACGTTLLYPDDPGGTPVTLPLLQESTPLYLVAGIVLAVLLLAVIFMMSRKNHTR